MLEKEKADLFKEKKLSNAQLIKLVLLACIPKDMSYVKGYLQAIKADFALHNPSMEELSLYILAATLAGESEYVNALGKHMHDKKLAAFLNILIQARAKNYANSLSFYKKSKNIPLSWRKNALFYASQGMDAKWLAKALALVPKMRLGDIYEMHLCCEEYKKDHKYAFLQALDLLDKGKINQILLALTCDYALSFGCFYQISSRLKHLRMLCDTPFLQATLGVFVGIWFYLRGERKRALSVLRANIFLLDYKEDKFNKNHQVFFALIYNYTKILRRDDHVRFVRSATTTPSPALLAIGASETLILANNYIKLKGVEYKVIPCFVMGLKAYHYGKENKYAKAICAHFEYIKELKIKYDLLFTSGNIDCRSNEGIWKNSFLAGKSWRECMKRTCDDYVKAINDHCKGLEAKVYIQGVQAVKYKLEKDYDPKDKKEFLVFMREYNAYLGKVCKEYGFYFVDIFTPTLRDDGYSNGLYDIDDHHVDITVYERITNATS